MPTEDLLSFVSEEFRFSVWCADISARLAAYRRTMARHAAETQPSERHDQTGGTELRISPPLRIAEVSTASGQASTSAPVSSERHETCDVIALSTPLFFENLAYLFEWEFSAEIQAARVMHSLTAVNDQFRFVPKRGTSPARLQGTVLTGNDVGWFRLPVELTFHDGRQVMRSISFEVLPTKMLMHSDLNSMYKVIDTEVPLWRFRLVSKTEQSAARRSERREDVFLMWLANFRALREEFERGLDIICNAPHRRLQTYETFQRADRIKGRLSNKRAEKIRGHIQSGQYARRYSVRRRYLSVDTPENRFVKHIVTRADKRLRALYEGLEAHEDAPEHQRISEAFFEEIAQWRAPLQQMLRKSFLTPIEADARRAQESLVLQQRAGYSAVYRTWQQLKLYLDVLGDGSQISMRSVAQIYEVWCFLTVAQILEEDLGFEAQSETKNELLMNSVFEYEYAENYFEERKFWHPTLGITATLQYEPTFSKGGNASGIQSFSTPQRPDIYLEVTDVTGRRYVWVFDAKYRVATDPMNAKSASEAMVDSVPSDAINQMHRYRDALIRVERGAASASGQKSRPVIGAFCLYPGFFDQALPATHNPYWRTISEVGIGAFPLLPREDQSGRAWLSEFLAASLALNEDRADHNFLEEPRRIPSDGMQQLFYRDLVFTASLGRYAERSDAYFNAFEQGTARYYHMPVRTFSLRFSAHIAREIRYLALASSFDVPSASITKIWPVKSVEIKQRRELSETQTGTPSESTAPYYLFTLDAPFTLDTPIRDIPRTSFRASMRLTTLASLQESERFSDLTAVYDGVLT